jgi:hypothetical protein
VDELELFVETDHFDADAHGGFKLLQILKVAESSFPHAALPIQFLNFPVQVQVCSSSMTQLLVTFRQSILVGNEGWFGRIRMVLESFSG